MSAGQSNRGTEVELSLVLPCYNEQDHLESLLRDWLRGLETLTPCFEIIVVNDGSRDRSGRVLDRLRKETLHLRVVHQLNSGSERACRRGLELARGAYVIQGECSGRYRMEDYRHLWEQRDTAELLLGFRPDRPPRWSETLRCRTARFLFGSAFQEPSLPLRLYRGAALRTMLSRLPRNRENLHLLMTLCFFHRFSRGVRGQGVREIAVPYRRRFGGKSRKSLGYAAARTLLAMGEMAWLRTRRTSWEILPAPTPSVP